MTKQEFQDFCKEEFLKRGFQKKRNMYYLQGKDILCGLFLQKSMSEAYYVNYYFFIGEYTDSKQYPTKYEADVYMRFSVLAKDLDENDETFMDACIEYELYDPEEVRYYFNQEFEEHVMPIIEGGIEGLEKDWDYFREEMFEENIESLLKKIKAYKGEKLI